MRAAKTRICIVNPFQHGGGAEFQISLLTAALHAAGRYETFYLARHVEPRIRPEGYSIVRIGRSGTVPPLGYVTDFLPLYRALSRIEPQVIYQRVAGGYTGVCAFWARRHRSRMIWHVAHDTDVQPQTLDSGRNIVRRKLEKCSVEYAIRRADRIVVQTHDQAQLLSRNYGRQADAVIPNFHPEPAEQPDKSGPPTVVWISNFKTWKRPEVFARLAQALRDLAGVRFLMFGEAPTGPKSPPWCTELMQTIKATPNLEYMGRRSQEEINQYLARASIFVNTSEHEGFPNTFVQAWLRKAVVISLTVNPDRVLDSKRVGIHAGTEVALVEAVRHLLSDSTQREVYAQRAREHARLTHSITNIGQLTELIDACAASV